MTIAIQPIGDADADAVEALLDEAFGRDRHGRTAYRLRAGMTQLRTLSFAAFDGAVLVGSLQCWPIALHEPDGAQHPLVLLGPIAVSPAVQRSGVGRTMIDRALAAADAEQVGALVLIGDPEYYGRFFGFSADATEGWDVPGPVERRRLLARLAPDVSLPKHGLLGPALCAPAFPSLDRAHA